MNKRELELNQALEVMHFGFRAMILQPDQVLSGLGLSRVHHRILYFIGRNSRCSVTELLSILKVTKQYINRPLKTLIEQGYVEQQSDARDRRVKRLQLTSAGFDLENQLSGAQRARFEKIFAEVGSEAETHWRQVMTRLANELSDTE